jgi:hypothetical protein
MVIDSLNELFYVIMCHNNGLELVKNYFLFF